MHPAYLRALSIQTPSASRQLGKASIPAGCHPVKVPKLTGCPFGQIIHTDRFSNPTDFLFRQVVVLTGRRFCQSEHAVEMSMLAGRQVDRLPVLLGWQPARLPVLPSRPSCQIGTTDKAPRPTGCPKWRRGQGGRLSKLPDCSE